VEKLPEYPDEMLTHTERKVAIYAAYLDRYLQILTNVPFVKEIAIFEPFAGAGVYLDQRKGSARTAYEIILQNRNSKRMTFFANELDSGKFQNLSSSMEPEDWVNLSNTDAKEFIEKIIPIERRRRRHRLFFIDPYGYTQIGKQDVDNVLALPDTEVLLFIPLSFIYRFFRNPGDVDVDQDVGQLGCIQRFLESYQLDKRNALDSSNAENFARVVKEGMESEALYVGYATLPAGSNCYALYFLGRHRYGMEKFLESADAIEREYNRQLELQLIYPDNNELLKFIALRRESDDIYEWSLRNNMPMRTLKRALKTFEDQEEIDIEVLDGKRRQRGKFPLGHKEGKRFAVRARQRRLL
jgi:three-Cys-motif partner protein